MLSATTSVDPSAVMTSPFAIRSPSLTARAEPSGSTRSSGARWNLAPPWKSKPNWLMNA